MTAPTSIRILHLNFDLIFVSPEVSEQAEAFGWTDKVRQKIFIQSGLRPRMTADVVLHETTHGIWLACGIPDEVTEEQACSMLSGPLLFVLSENPQLREWLFELMNQQ